VDVTQTRTEAPSSRGAGAGRGGRLGRFIREVISELRKVLWPTRNELVTYTIVVIVFVVIMISIVAGLDVGFAKLVLAVFG
jgi:preprotein translocase subunit SecE